MRVGSGLPRGSSPLARGLQDLWSGARRLAGIIPARAGFTPIGSGIRSNRSDHPRSRGVYNRASGMRPSHIGSSPLARGLRWISLSSKPRRGIIPARAGFTQCSISTRTMTADHPRSRGVYSTPLAASCAVTGSSPLARGLPHARTVRARGWRIIPARAGFTNRRWRPRSATQDHPRSRGVYYPYARIIVIPVGSSPLARGLRRPTRNRGRYRRDHPRSRGVYAQSIAGIKRNPRLVLRFEFGVVAVGRVWFRLDSGCRSPV